VYDVSNPMRPVQIGYFTGLISSGDFEVVDDVVYIAQQQVGFYAIDFGDPANPEVIASLGENLGTNGLVAPSGGRLFHLDPSWTGHRLLRGYDLSGGMPQQDFMMPSYRVEDFTRYHRIPTVQVLAAGPDFVLVDDAFTTDLRVLDTASPGIPEEIARVPLESEPWLLALHRNLLLASTSDGLVVVEMSRPDSPRIVAEYPARYSSIVMDGYDIFGAGLGGVEQLRLRPDKPEIVEAEMLRAGAGDELFQNAPNPFNPTTTIRFRLADAARAELTVFDVRGRRIRTLVDEVLSAGEHAQGWDGTNQRGEPVASGVYFYRLTAGDFRETRRMLLLK
jgi:hypothetical protein